MHEVLFSREQDMSAASENEFIGLIRVEERDFVTVHCQVVCHVGDGIQAGITAGKSITKVCNKLT